MFVFTVSVAVKLEIASEWRKYMLEKHINDVLKTGCFMKAEFEEVESDGNESNQFRARYFFESKSDYERYIKNFASDLRAEHNQLFGEQVEAQRTVSYIREFMII